MALRKLSDISVRNCQNCSNEIARFNLKIELAFSHLFSASLFQNCSQLTVSGETECIWRIRILSRFHNRSTASFTVEKKGLASSTLQTANATYPSFRITLSASRTADNGVGEKHC